MSLPEPTTRLRRADAERPSVPVWPGVPTPLGARWDGEGVNFALYSEHATRVLLCLFDDAGDAEPSHTIELPERTGAVWHGFVPGLEPGQLYGYRVDGPDAPRDGHLFNPSKLLLDPYAKAIGRPLAWHESLYGYHRGDEPSADGAAAEVEAEADASGRRPRLRLNTLDSAAHAPLGAVVDDTFAWGTDLAPNVPWEDTIIYEAHVKGISQRHPDVPEAIRGTYLGLASEPVVEHLLRLGVTTVQLLPVQAFVNDHRLVEMGLSNYWGYNPLAYLAPEPSYASGGPESAVHEFKTLVRRLHAAGLEVIIDVVYNHTGEGNHLGPTLSWRGIDNGSYYKLTPDDARYYMDYTGTGNTLDAGNAFVLQLITDSLRYWVNEMHVDGFRFDLASALARELYDVDMLSAFFKVIQQDPVLSRVKLIAEPWDVGPGGYQVGNFPWMWCEWNGRYRDAVRGYWRGARGTTGELATRVAGSSDLYALSGRKPYHSVNFVTAHDGYTLHDLVSYDRKHNHANGEKNRDGHDHNLSQNCGVEGPTDLPEVLRKRRTLKRSLLATLMLSQGIPMILGGDELSRTQRGNNNAYCQDNEISWYDWELDPEEEDFLAFTRELVRFRAEHPVFRRRSFLTGEPNEDGVKDVSWWHPDGREMGAEDWHDERLGALGMVLCGRACTELDARGNRRRDLSHLVLFHSDTLRAFTIPRPPDGEAWRVAWSTAPDGAAPVPGTPLEPGVRIELVPYALTVLQAH